jgi:hypothetical protein
MLRLRLVICSGNLNAWNGKNEADDHRFNVQCAMEMFAQQPAVNPTGMASD